MVPSLSLAFAVTVMFVGAVSGAPATGFVRATDGAVFDEALVVTTNCGLFAAASREFRVTNTVEDDGLRRAKLITLVPAFFSLLTWFVISKS